MTETNDPSERGAMRNLLTGLFGILFGGAVMCCGGAGAASNNAAYRLGTYMGLATGGLIFLVSIPYAVMGLWEVASRLRDDARAQMNGPGGGRRRKRKDPTRPKAPSRDAVAEKAEATKALLARAGMADDWLEPKYLEDIVADLFQLFQEGWEADDFTALKPWMTPDCYRRYVDRADHPTRRLKILRYDEVDLDRVRFVHAAITKEPEDQSVTLLLTGDGADRLAECWTFARTPARWVLERIVSLGSSDAVARLNDAPLPVLAALKAEGEVATLKHVAHG